MKIIIAPDSFKGCMRSTEVCNCLENGIKMAVPSAEIIKIPMADGGEGTATAIITATGGNFQSVTVHDPLGREITARYGILGDGNTAVMEMASACGLELLRHEELNPLLTSTYGIGELFMAILSAGIRNIIVGIGGSATNDGGAGMAQAIGYRLLDKNRDSLRRGCGGGDLDTLCHIDTQGVLPELKKTRIRVACDVTNPLLGTKGASVVYGPQKGATPAMVKRLEANLSNYAEILKQSELADDCNHPGDGAAGGLGFGLRTLTGAQMVSGAELVIEVSGFMKMLRGADLVITGEGCTDTQTAFGKICAVIGTKAQAAGIPVLLISGALKGDYGTLNAPFTAAFSIARGPCTLNEALSAAPENLYAMGKNIGGMLQMLKKCTRLQSESK